MTLSYVLLASILFGSVPAAPGNLDVSLATAPAAPTPVAGGVAWARDPGRGVPTLLWTPGGEPPPAGVTAEAAARRQLSRRLAVYGAPPEVVDGARTRYVHDTGRGGIVVALRQTVGGVELFHGDVKLLLDRSHRLLAISGAPHPAAHPGGARAFVRGPALAVAAALRDLHGAAAKDVRVVEVAGRDGWRRYQLAEAGRVVFREPARVKPVYLPVGDALVPGHLVELQSSAGGAFEVFNYVIAADDDRVLVRRDATARAHKYRVWAEADGRPLDGPLVDFNPHPAGVPTAKPEEATAPGLVTMHGFNTNPDGVSDPWLADGATQTRGNNVDAYSDDDDGDTSAGKLRATTTAPGTFDRVYDVGAQALASDEQRMAALTHLFFVINWMHDWWYDSGFVEATGAAQTDNYGRGGEGGDVLLAEGQNGATVGQRDEANMATPLDGASPRMQVSVYTGSSKPGGVELMPGEAFKGYPASFGPIPFDVTGPLVAMVDGGGDSPSDGCEAPAIDVAGKIVLVDRGACTYETKTKQAEAAGAIGVIIADHTASSQPPALGNDDAMVDPKIPTVGVTLASGDALKVALEMGDPAARIFGAPGIEPDASADSLLIAHEWGHYIHHRLVECGSQACRAQSEGWGDFNGLLLALREGDPTGAVYVLNYYMSLDASGYFNHRRAAFSVDPAKNAFSFRHIADGEPLPMEPWLAPDNDPNSQIHNAGEIWTAMLWESYVALHDERGEELGFAGVHRRMSDYVVAGMMLAPPDPTYTEQRDAILMAIAAADADDLQIVAEAFARRGAGTCAVSPPRHSLDLVGVVEDFEVRGRAAIVSASLADSVDSCDQDGVVDVGEVGRVEVEVFNGGVAGLAGATVEVVDPDPALVFPDGTTIAVPELAPLASATVGLAVAASPGLAGPTAAALRLRVTAPGGCEAPAEMVVPVELHSVLSPGSSASDDVEAGAAWTAEGAYAETIWSRAAGPDGHRWRGVNVSHVSDTALVSPPLAVSQDQPVVIAFDHAFQFDHDQGNPWDGGVIELSSDDGKTWHDLAEMTDQTGYTGTIKSAMNALTGRPGFVGQSEGWPGLQPWSVDLGDKLAGLTMRLRFRIATNTVVSAGGWQIDNINISGLVSGPFPSWGPDAGACEDPTTGGEEPTGGPDTSGGESGDDSATAGPEMQTDDAGCGCATDNGGWSALGLLSLLGWRRRRA
jgi:uncharacterized protein (TIGR03382 family)